LQFQRNEYANLTQGKITKRPTSEQSGPSDDMAFVTMSGAAKDNAYEYTGQKNDGTTAFAEVIGVARSSHFCSGAIKVNLGDVDTITISLLIVIGLFFFQTSGYQNAPHFGLAIVRFSGRCRARCIACLVREAKHPLPEGPRP